MTGRRTLWILLAMLLQPATLLAQWTPDRLLGAANLARGPRVCGQEPHRTRRLLLGRNGRRARAKLESLRAAGAPVEWHVYPETTHCWDCQHLDGYSKTDVRGNNVVYRYSRETTQDSKRRLFEFLQKHLGRP